MKKLAVWVITILLGVLSVVLIGGCQGQIPFMPSPEPTVTAPPSSPPPVPPTPPGLPQPSPGVPLYDVTLVSFNGVLEGHSPKHMRLYFTGEVRNDSPVELKAVDVVITSYKENGDIVAIDRWMTHPWVIQPGGISEFSIRVDDYINAERYVVSFEHLDPGILDLSVKSGVSEVFRVP